MKQMQRDPLASSKARKAERKADEKSGLITIKPVKLDAQPTASAAGGGFKKGGFKNAFGDDKKDDADAAKSPSAKASIVAEETELGDLPAAVENVRGDEDRSAQAVSPLGDMDLACEPPSTFTSRRPIMAAELLPEHKPGRP
ncbi:MAG: hypothetical protein M1827_005917 [Pycnora praestabilis]|nr:MAG: hypothetical protein M1827_005917 [Pycnora praestabilis]